VYLEPAAPPPSVCHCGRSSKGCKGVTSRGIVRQSGASVLAGRVRGLHEALRLSHVWTHGGLSHDTKTVGNRSVSMSRNAPGHGPASLTRNFGHRLVDSLSCDRLQLDPKRLGRQLLHLPVLGPLY
jgi:hypothetical protein